MSLMHLSKQGKGWDEGPIPSDISVVCRGGCFRDPGSVSSLDLFGPAAEGSCLLPSQLEKRHRQRSRV